MEETPQEGRGYYSYVGLAITLIGLGLQVYGVHDAEARSGAVAIEGWFVSAIGLALYADAKGHSTIVGFFLGFIMFIGPLLGLLYFRDTNEDKPQRVRANLRKGKIQIFCDQDAFLPSS